MGIYNLISFAGIFILLAAAWSLSSDRRRMNWKLILWGSILQVLVALFVFKIPAGMAFFKFLNTAVINVLDCAQAGAKFMFGRLALPPGQVDGNGEGSLGFILAFQAFPTIIFFSSLISILYFLKIMPFIIRFFSSVFTRLMKVSGAESLVVASNIFTGIESNLVAMPYLNRMTRSELCTILTAGMATVASNIMALYIFGLKGQFPDIAAHLISASLLSAPAALIMSKIIVPEKEKPETLGLHIAPYYEREKNIFEAVITGANSGVRMIIGIVALLLAVLGMISLFNLLLAAAGAKINSLLGINFLWSLENILGYIFYPFALIMGIPPADAGTAAQLIGQRVVVTEVVAYQNLAVILSNHSFVFQRSALITAYALCGFAHLASMAIFVGGVSALAPQKTSVIASVGFRALIAATLACFMTACIAGTFYTSGYSLLLGK